MRDDFAGKAALAHRRAAALDHAGDGIRVNAVGPGFIDTPLLANAPQEVVAGVAALHPLGRLGSSREVAELVCFLGPVAVGSDGHQRVVGRLWWLWQPQPSNDDEDRLHNLPTRGVDGCNPPTIASPARIPPTIAVAGCNPPTTPEDGGGLGSSDPPRHGVPESCKVLDRLFRVDSLSRHQDSLVP